MRHPFDPVVQPYPRRHFPVEPEPVEDTGNELLNILAQKEKEGYQVKTKGEEEEETEERPSPLNVLPPSIAAGAEMNERRRRFFAELQQEAAKPPPPPEPLPKRPIFQPRIRES